MPPQETFRERLLPGVGAPDCVVTSYFLLGNADGDNATVCIGHGTCVGGRCVCDAWWTGRSDVFTAEGYACHNPIVLDKLSWAFVVVAWVVLLWRTWPAFVHHVRQYQAEAAALRKNGRTQPYDAKRSLAAHAGLMATMPLMIWASIHRVASVENFGVDIPVTIPLMLWYVFHIPGQHIVNHLVFKSVANGAFRSHQQNAIVRLDDKIGMRFVWVTTAMQVVLLIAGLILPVGPTVARIILVILRSVVLIFFVATQYIRSVVIRRRIKELMAITTSNSNNHNNHGSDKNSASASSPRASSPRNPGTANASTPESAQNEKLAAVLRHLETNQKSAQVFIVVFVVLGVVFSLPWLITFSYVYLGFVLVIGTSSAHVVYVFSPQRRKELGGGATVDVDAVAVVASSSVGPGAPGPSGTGTGGVQIIVQHANGGPGTPGGGGAGFTPTSSSVVRGSGLGHNQSTATQSQTGGGGGGA